MIFRTIDELNKDGEVIGKKVGWSIGGIGSYHKLQSDNDDILQAAANDRNKKLIEQQNRLIKEQGMVAGQAAKQLGITEGAMHSYMLANEKGEGSVEDFNKQQKKAAKQSKGLSKGISASTKALLGNIGIDLAIGLLLNKVFDGIQQIDQKYGISRGARLDNMQERISKYNTATADSQNNKRTIQSLSDEYNRLARGVDSSGRNIGLSTQQFERYNEIVAQLVELNPEIVQGYTAEGNAIINRNTAIKDSIALQEDYAKQALATYTTNESGKDIIKGSYVEMTDAIKEMRKYGRSIAKEMDEIVTANYDQMGHTQSEGLNKALGKYIDVETASFEELKELGQKRGEILKYARENDFTDQQIEGLTSDLNEIRAYTDEYEQATQPIVDWLNAYLSRVDEETGNSISENIPEAMRESFQSGLREIAVSGEDAIGMKRDAAILAETITENYKDNVNGIREIYNSAEKAKDKYLKSETKGHKITKATNDILAEQADKLSDVAKMYENTNPALAEYYRNEAANMRNFVEENKTSIENSIGAFDDLISAARNAKSEFDESLSAGDYYTGIENFNSIYDTIFNGQNELGRGSLAFWQGAEQILGTGALKEADYNIEAVKQQLQALQPMLAGGAEGASLFAEKLLSIGDGNGNILNEYGEKIGEVAETANGITFDIPRKNIDAVARKLGVSSETLTAMIDSARQFANVNFYNIDEVKKAIKRAASDGEKALEGSNGTYYMGLTELRTQSGLQGIELENLVNELSQVGVKIIDADANAQDLKKSLSGLGVLEGKKLDLDTTIEKFHKMNISADDLSKILGTLEHNGINIGDIGDADSNLDYILDQYTKLDELASNETVIQIRTQFIGVNEVNRALSEIEGLNDREQTRIVNAVVEYQKSGDAENLAKELNGLPDEVRSEIICTLVGEEEAEEFSEFLDGFDLKNHSTTVTAETDGEGKVLSLKGIISSITDRVVSLIGNIFGFDSLPTLSNLWNGIKSKTVSLIANVTQNGGLSGVISGIFGHKADGTPTRRKQSNYPSMAKGGVRGKLGPHGRGGLTLTGELGTELVWSPSEGISYLVGQYGPEMVNLPGDAVVYPADETRRILGDTVPLHRYNYGALASGNVAFGSAAGGAASGVISRLNNRGGSSSKYSSNSKSGSKSSSKSNESEYEKELKALQHELNMGYITEKQYYDKLNALYEKHKKALSENVDDQRKALEDLRKAWIDAYKAAEDLIRHDLEMGVINEAQYYDKLKALGDQYYKGRRGYEEEYRDHLESLKKARNDAYEAELEDLNKQLEKEKITIEKYFAEVQKLQTQWLSGKEMAKDLEEALDDMYDQLKDKLDDMFDDVQQKISDNDLWRAWTEGGDDAVKMLEDFRDLIINNYKDYFATEQEYRDFVMEIEREIQEAIDDRYNEEKDHLDEINDLVEATIRFEAKERIKALEKVIDSYNEIISKKKKSLKLAEDELQLQEEMADYAKNISKLETEIRMLARDDSRSAAAKRAEKEEELAELLKEQQKTIRENTLDKTIDMLEEQGERFEELMNKQIEVIEEWLDNISAVLEEIAKTIENRETNDLLARVILYNSKEGDGLQLTVDNAFKDLNALINKYGNDWEKITEILQKAVDDGKTGGIIPAHHSGLAKGFTGDGATRKQKEVYRLLTDDELVFNREDQMRIANQLQVLDTIKSSFGSLAKGVYAQPVQNTQSVELVVNAPITIEGNATSDTAREIKRAITEASNDSLNKLNEALRINGVHSRVTSNVRKN